MRKDTIIGVGLVVVIVFGMLYAYYGDNTVEVQNNVSVGTTTEEVIEEPTIPAEWQEEAERRKAEYLEYKEKEQRRDELQDKIDQLQQEYEALDKEVLEYELQSS